MKHERVNTSPVLNNRQLSYAKTLFKNVKAQARYLKIAPS